MGCGVPVDADGGELAVFGELEGRAILIDREGKMVSALPDKPNQQEWGAEQAADTLRKDAFDAPHGIKWGPHGEIDVSEWSRVGRLLSHPV